MGLSTTTPVLEAGADESWKVCEWLDATLLFTVVAGTTPREIPLFVMVVLLRWCLVWGFYSWMFVARRKFPFV